MWHHKESCMTQQLFFETQASHTSRLHNLPFRQLSEILLEERSVRVEIIQLGIGYSQQFDSHVSERKTDTMESQRESRFKYRRFFKTKVGLKQLIATPNKLYRLHNLTKLKIYSAVEEACIKHNIPLVICQGKQLDLELATLPLEPAKTRELYITWSIKRSKPIKILIPVLTTKTSIHNISTLHHSTSSPLADEKATPEKA